MNDSTNEPQFRSTRRTVAKGAAWAVPVIAVGAAAPVMASSPPDIDVELDPLLSCKFPGQSSCADWGYRLVFRITSTTALILAVASITAPNNEGDEVQILDVVGDGPGGLIALAAGVERIAAVVIGAENSANGTATITITTQDGTTLTRTFQISNFHPCDRDLEEFCP
jgi:hypothetical protein